MSSELLNRQGFALFLRRIQKQQDFQHIVKPPARIEAPAERLALPIRQRRSQHRTAQHQRPQQIQPQQEKRHSGKCAVNRAVAVEIAHIPSKQETRRLQAKRRNQSPDERLPRRHKTIRHKAVQAPQQQRHEKQRPRRPQHPHPLGRSQRRFLHRPDHKRNPHAQRQRSKRQQRPIHQKLHHPRPLRIDPPNPVERIINRPNQHQRRNHQHHTADRRQLPRLIAERIDIIKHHVRTLRHNSLIDERNKRIRPTVEHRKNRSDRHHHRQYRHQSQKRRKRHTRRSLRHTLLIETPDHKPRKRKRLTVRQTLPPFQKRHNLSRKNNELKIKNRKRPTSSENTASAKLTPISHQPHCNGIPK